MYRYHIIVCFVDYHLPTCDKSRSLHPLSPGQHMQYWLCEYQCERDVTVACRKLNGFLCHGTTLKVTPALKVRSEIPQTTPKAAVSVKPLKCRVCDKKYTNKSDLKTHLLLSHCLYMHKEPSKTMLRRGKIFKERDCSRTLPTKKTDQSFNVKQWLEDRPHRNPDYIDPQNYVLDSVIGVSDENEKLGFIPIDHTYVKLSNVVRGTIPNSVLNGPNSITFHPSMVCLVKQNSKTKYVPVEHSYSTLEPQALWCSVCGRQYDSLESLTAHLPVHFRKKGEKAAAQDTPVNRKRKLKRAPKDEVFTCKMCSSEFNSKSQFIAHVTAHEGDDEMEVVTQKCKYCELNFNSSEKLASHQEQHECKVCRENFACLKKAQSHRESHVLLEKARCCCEICGEKFLNANDFLLHLQKENHPITKQSRRILSIPRHAEHFNDFSFQQRNEEFHCLKCSKTCQSDLELYSHMGFHFVHKTIPPPYVLPPEVEEVSQTSDESPVKEYEPVKVRIPLSTVLSASGLSPAKKPVLHEEPGEPMPGDKVCPRCSKKFKKYRSLVTHYRFCKQKPLEEVRASAEVEEEAAKPIKEPIKSPPLNFKCIKCDLGFISEFLLKSHINMAHPQSEEKTQVKLGKARKSAVKLFKCSECDKTFAQELGLKAHHTAAHSDIGAKPPEKVVLPAPPPKLKDVLKDAPQVKIIEKAAPPITPDVPKQSDTKRTVPEESESEITPMKPRGLMKSPPQEQTGIIRARKTAAKLFKCKACDIRFGSKRILAFHMQQHAEGKIKSKGAAEPLGRGLTGILENHNPPENNVPEKRHFSSDSGPQEPSKDDISNMPLSVLKSRKVAKKTIIKKVFECDICESFFTKRSQYISHIKSHTNDPTETSSLSEETEEGEVSEEETQQDNNNDNSHMSNSFSTPSENTDNMEVSVPLPKMNDSTDIIPADAIFYVDDDKLDGLMEETSQFDNSNSMSFNEAEHISSNMFINGDSTIEEVKTCNICKKQFLAWSTICAHMSTHPNSTFKDVSVDWKSMFNPLFECVICKEKVHSVAHCYLHYKYHVLEHSSNPVMCHLDISSEGDRSDIFKCSVCGNRFDKIGTLHTHMKVHVPRVGFNDPTQVVSDPTHERCEVCHRVVTPKSRRRHHQIHDQPLKHICEVCFEEFPNQRGYVLHYYHTHKTDVEKALKLTASATNNGRSQHNSSSTADFHCTYCRSTFLSLKSKRNHEYKHKKQIFKIPCVFPDCLLHFQSPEELIYHVDKVGHATGPQTIPCSMCAARFMSTAPKLHHEKTAHGLDVDLDGVLFVPNDQTPDNDSPPKPAKLNCSKCSLNFESFEKLKYHEAYQHTEATSENSAQVAVDKNAAPNSEEFTCMICSLSFKTYSERWLHEEEYEKPGCYRCMDCGLDYKTKHQKSGHECNTRASTPDTPTEQVPSVSMPTSGRPLVTFTSRKCHACNKLFNDKESYKYHVRKHWYRCFSCHYDFCSKKSMKAHLKLQKCFHPKTKGFERVFEEILVECLLCDEVRSINDHINLHFLEHTIKENGKYDMFICLMCGAPYKIIEQLQEHMRTEGYFLMCREAPHLKDLDLSSLDKDSDAVKESDEAATAAAAAANSHQWGCPFCTTTYQNYKSAWSHIRSYHKSVGVPFKLEDHPGQSESTSSEKVKSKEGPLLPPPLAKPSPSGPPNANSEEASCSNEVGKARLLLSELLNKSQDAENRQKTRPPLLNHADITSPTRTRNESESSSGKKAPRITSPEAAAKTAGLIAQFLRGPGSSPLLPTPKPAPTRHPAPNQAVRPPPPSAGGQYKDFSNTRPHLPNRASFYPSQKPSSHYRPHQNENMRRNYTHQGSRVQNMQHPYPHQQNSSYGHYGNGYISNKRMRFDHPTYPDQYQNGENAHYRPSGYSSTGNHHAHDSWEEKSWQIANDSNPSPSGNKTLVHKCTYCQRIFKSYANVYDHLMRTHLGEIGYRNGSQVRPISTFDGRSTVWSLTLAG